MDVRTVFPCFLALGFLVEDLPGVSGLPPAATKRRRTSTERNGRLTHPGKTWDTTQREKPRGQPLSQCVLYVSQRQEETQKKKKKKPTDSESTLPY